MELNFVFRSQILISEYILEFRFKKGGRDRKRAKDSQNGFERSRGSVYHEILRRISNSSRFQATGDDRFRGKHIASGRIEFREMAHFLEGEI